jgi:hypothetical protein
MTPQSLGYSSCSNILVILPISLPMLHQFSKKTLVMTVAILTDDVLSSSQTSFIRLMSGELAEWKMEKEWNVLM